MLTITEEDDDMEMELEEENIEEIPIIQTIRKKNILVIESQNQDDESEIIADIKGLETEIKPMLPKPSKEKGKIL